MSEQEDYNEFNCWDCGGAAGLLAFTPAALYYVFSDHDKQGTILFIAVAGGVAVVVFLLAWLLGSRLVSRGLQLVGSVLCLLFWVYAIHQWMNSHKFDAVRDTPAQQAESAR